MTSAATAAAPAGGWCSFLENPAPGWGVHRRPNQPLNSGDVTLIVDYLGRKLWEGLGDVQRINPLAQTMVNNTLTAAKNYLDGQVAAGGTCETLPNDPNAWPGVSQPDSVGDVLSGFLNWTGLGAVLGDTLVRIGVLVAILVLVLLAIRRVLS